MKGQNAAMPKKFYVNVCRPLAPVKGVACGRFASVCVTEVGSDGQETR